MAVDIDLVEADDAYDPLGVVGDLVTNCRSEEHVRGRSPFPRGFRVHDLRGVDPLPQEVNPAIDFAEPLLVVLVVGVLAAVAVAGCPRDDAGHGWPLPGEQEPQLVSEPLQAARRDVVRVLHSPAYSAVYSPRL